MSGFEIHRPEGVVLPTDSWLYEHVEINRGPIVPLKTAGEAPPELAPGKVCRVRLGTVCPHGYRLDHRGATLHGRGCRVVALEYSRDLLGFDTDRLPPGLVQELTTLPAGSPVEVLLDDGRVVVTRVRHPASDLHGTWMAWLHGFTGCYLLARCRPAGWPYWSKRLDRKDGVSLRLDIVAGEVVRPDE